MKIIPSVVLAVMLGASTLFAGDEENAKAVVVKDWQLAAAGKTERRWTDAQLRTDQMAAHIA